jgi:hypothetical protein
MDVYCNDTRRHFDSVFEIPRPSAQEALGLQGLTDQWQSFNVGTTTCFTDLHRVPYWTRSLNLLWTLEGLCPIYLGVKHPEPSNVKSAEAADDRSNNCIHNMIRMSSKVLLLRLSECVSNDNVLKGEKDASESYTAPVGIEYDCVDYTLRLEINMR